MIGGSFVVMTSGCKAVSKVTCTLIGKINEHGPGGEKFPLRAV
jgi:hypothetical protein